MIVTLDGNFKSPFQVTKKPLTAPNPPRVPHPATLDAVALQSDNRNLNGKVAKVKAAALLKVAENQLAVPALALLERNLVAHLDVSLPTIAEARKKKRKVRRRT